MSHGRTGRVAEQLVELVLDGTFGPGATLPAEAALADRFGVSRLTVREAIKSLASTRMIRVRQGKPSLINPPDLWSPLDPRLLEARGHASGEPMMLPRRLLEARRILEVGTAELAAQRCEDRHLADLQTFLERMRESHQRGEVDRFVEADLAFHQTLFDVVGNVFLDALLEPLTLVLRTMRTRTSSVAQIREHAIDWHTTILAALTTGDPTRAREAMRGHLVQTEDDLIAYLTTHPDPAGSRPRLPQVS